MQLAVLWGAALMIGTLTAQLDMKFEQQSISYQGSVKEYYCTILHDKGKLQQRRSDAMLRDASLCSIIHVSKVKAATDLRHPASTLVESWRRDCGAHVWVANTGRWGAQPV